MRRAEFFAGVVFAIAGLIVLAAWGEGSFADYLAGGLVGYGASLIFGDA